MRDRLPDEYNEGEFDIYDPPPDNLQDPHSTKTRELAIAYERASNHISYKKREFLNAIFKGYGPKKAADMAGYAHIPCYRQHLNDPTSPEAVYLSTLRQVYMLNMGPTIIQRKTLLWDIALNHKDKSPAASIKAVDVLNRMDGIYTEQPTGAVTINQNVYNDINWGDLALISQAQQKAIEHV